MLVSLPFAVLVEIHITIIVSMATIPRSSDAREYDGWTWLNIRGDQTAFLTVSL